jgi:uncharacterized membrane-anchored protein
MKNDKDLERLRKVSLFMEKFWLLIAVVSLVVVIYLYFQPERNKGEVLTYLIFPALAGLMFAFRRTFRKRQEKNSQNSSNE